MTINKYENLEGLRLHRSEFKLEVLENKKATYHSFTGGQTEITIKKATIEFNYKYDNNGQNVRAVVRCESTNGNFYNLDQLTFNIHF